MTINELRITFLIAKRERFIGLRDGFELASINARKIIDTYHDLSLEQKRYYEENVSQGRTLAQNYQEKIDKIDAKLEKLGVDLKIFDCLDDDSNERI